MTLLARSLLVPMLTWVGLAIPGAVYAQSGSRQATNVSANQGVAVVELFTSQGCSSCPSADVVLQKIAASAAENDLPVFVLSFHVDYWNRLGWTDPYSDSKFSQRQRAYARAMKSNRVYTPQMIVNGKTEFVGSHRGKANQAIAKSLRQSANVTITASLKRSTSNQQSSLRYQLSGKAAGNILNVAVVETPEPNSVPRGENSGRDLQHVNVVRSFQSIPIEGLSGELTLEMPDRADYELDQVIVYVQDQRTLSVLGATLVN